MSISSDDDTDSTEKSDGEYDSELDPDMDMRMEDDVDMPDGVDLDGDVDMETDGDDDEEEDQEEEDEDKEDKEEDEDEDDGKEPRTIGQGEMVNTSADDADTTVDNEPTVLPDDGQEMEQGQEMREHTPRPLPPAPAQWPQTPESPPRPRTLETHTLSGLEYLGLVMPQNPRPVAPTLREAEAAGNTSDVDVEQQLLGESAGGDTLPDVRLPDVPLLDVPLQDVPFPDGPLLHVPHPEARPDGSAGEE
jgi:hypothetical protein